MDYTKSSYAKFFGMAALVTLGGCAMTSGDKDPKYQTLRCGTDCRLELELPADNGRPRIPPGQERLEIKAGENVDLALCRAWTPSNQCLPIPGDIYLIFEKPAFAVRSPGQQPPGSPPPPVEPLWVIKLKPGQINKLRTMPLNSCPPPDGCKYTIVDLGNKQREPLDPWIILF